MKTATLLMALVLPAGSALGQVPDTTEATRTLGELVVTAERSETLKATSTGAVSVLRAEDLHPMPGMTNLADVLRLMPGFAPLHIDGLGYDPQPVVRGFYGGGEAEYVIVLLNGQPLNVFETGLVNWNQIPMEAVESVEVLRGGASSLYGDAAIGGIVNVRTSDEHQSGTRVSLTGGSFGSIRGGVATQLKRWLSGFGNVDRTAGYRDHANRFSASAGFSGDLIRKERLELTFAGLGHSRRYDVPGPLTQDQIRHSPSQVSPFHVLDHAEERAGQASLRARWTLPRGMTLDGSLTGAMRQLDMIRTLPLSAEFADAKQRDLQAARLFFTGQMVLPVRAGKDRLTVGTDLQSGRMDNAWYEVVTGPASVFADHSGDPGSVSTEGSASRQALAAYAQYDWIPASALKLTAGARLDRIGDDYTPSGGERSSASHRAFSPKVGLNVRYRSTAHQVGNWYANVSRSFKVATLDQLYDQRLIPVPFPPYGISISNDELKPQRGTSIETGLYHQAVLAEGSLVLDLSASAYQMDMKDELDFQFDTFSYANIARSRHRGVELGAKLDMQRRAGLMLNYTLQDVTYRAGSYEGNYVKAVPRHYVNLSMHVPVTPELATSATVRTARGVWLDDANLTPLDAYTTVDVRLAYAVGRVSLDFEVLNLMDSKYSTTGYLDPGGSETQFLYPASRRFFRAGMRLTL
ncbi:MAG: TonB-dependent receptor [Bacteroidota bacterium]|nr:TonB-dependent receptor [Bacteroidota bacterium]